MAQLPDVDEAGFRGLRQRIETALNVGVESPSVEFKTGESWQSLKPQIIRTVLAMSNTRDGGLIIIGRPEDRELPEGLTPAQLESYDPDVMRDAFDSYASPRVITNLVRLQAGEYRYVAVDVDEFDETPVICARNHGTGPSLYLRAGGVYTRPVSGRPRSDLIIQANEMRELIELAIDKSRHRFNERAVRRGYIQAATDNAQYVDELGDLA